MEDRSINRFSKIRSIVSGSSFAWNCCETNLIVDNNMNCSSNSVILQVLHLHCFVNNSLSGKWSITMDEDRYNLISILQISIWVKSVVFSSDSSHNHWIDTFQMGWISKNLNCEIFSIRVCLCIMSTQMIFHISRMSSVLVVLQISWSDTLELCKNNFKRLS